MNYLPICINVTNARIVVIGGGRVAAQKLCTLVQTPAQLTVFGSHVCEEIRAMPVMWTEAKYLPDQLTGAILVYACTDDREVNRRVGADARRAGILVNVADDPYTCDFISPALWSHGPMTVAVSSDATDPARSVAWRNALSEFGSHDLVLR